jgi:hypothetical protein
VGGSPEVGRWRARYLIGAEDPGLLRELTVGFAGDAEVAVRRVVGPHDAPRVLVVDTTPERADLLRAQYGPRLVVRADPGLPA